MIPLIVGFEHKGDRYTHFNLGDLNVGILDKISSLTRSPELLDFLQKQEQLNKAIKDEKEGDKKDDLLNEKINEILVLRSLLHSTITSCIKQFSNVNGSNIVAVDEAYESLPFVDAILCIFKIASALQDKDSFVQIIPCPKCGEYTDVHIHWGKYLKSVNKKGYLVSKLSHLYKYKDVEYNHISFRYPTISELFDFLKRFGSIKNIDSQIGMMGAFYTKDTFSSVFMPLMRSLLMVKEDGEQIEIMGKDCEDAIINMITSAKYDNLVIKIILCCLNIYQDIGLTLDIEDNDLKKYVCNEKGCGASLDLVLDFSNFFFFLADAVKTMYETTLTSLETSQKLFVDI